MNTLSATVERVDWATSSDQPSKRGSVINSHPRELTDTKSAKRLACDQRRQKLCHVYLYQSWRQGPHMGNLLLFYPRHLPKQAIEIPVVGVYHVEKQDPTHSITCRRIARQLILIFWQPIQQEVKTD